MNKRYKGAYLIKEKTALLSTLKDVYARLAESDWTEVNKDKKELKEKWRAVYFISNGKETPFVQRFAEMRTVAKEFPCEIGAMMFYVTLPGTVIPPHRDMSGNVPFGKIRFHIPVQTNPDVEFWVDKKRIPMGEGQVWALDTSYVHSVKNLTGKPRMHLIIEASLNDWVRSQMPAYAFGDRWHLAKFFFFAGVNRLKNVAKNPKLIGATAREVKNMASQLAGRKKK